MISFTTIVIIAAPWFIFKFSNYLVNSDINILNLTFGRFLSNLKGIPIVFYEFQKQVFGLKKWNIFWITVITIIILKKKKLFKSSCFYITLFVFVALAAYFAAYMCTTGETVFFYAKKTMSRFMIHFAGISMFLAMYLLQDESS